MSDKPRDPLLIKVLHDLVNEQICLSAMLSSADHRKSLARRLRPEHFLEARHRAIFEALVELERQGLEYDPATLKTLGEVDINYVQNFHEVRPEPPPNLEHHVERLLWDFGRATCTNGPLKDFLDALKNPLSRPERVKALAREVEVSLGNHDRRFLRDTGQVIRDQMADLEARMGSGHAVFPFGVPDLDEYPEGSKERELYGRYRIVPGAKPGTLTVLTGVSGAGKTTLLSSFVIGLVKQKRRVLWGAWEVDAGMNLEALAACSAGISKTRLMTGDYTRAELDDIHARMEILRTWVVFMDLPFGRDPGQRATNDRNLDLIHQYLADARCEVAIFDIWNRCLVDRRPEAEEHAIFRQQAILKETGVAGILVHQQRLGDIEKRDDPRPTRDGMKGSKGLVEAPDLILGVHKPSMYKPTDRETLEVSLLKQRFGRWPMTIAFDFDPAVGRIKNGRPVDQLIAIPEVQKTVESELPHETLFR